MKYTFTPETVVMGDLFDLAAEQDDEIPGLEYLGNPSLERYPDVGGLAYARSVWDLQAWRGRLYLGAGDSAENAGPVPVWCYDPKDGEFLQEFEVDDEQIERYCVLSDGLYIPGHDAMESWDYGNIYVHHGTGWTKLRTLPNAVHVYDIAEWEDSLVAVGAHIIEREEGVYHGGGAFYCSSDHGQSWDVEVTLSTSYEGSEVYDPVRPDAVRFTELFELDGKLYASGWFMPRIYIYEDGQFSFVDVNAFPGVAAGSGEPCGALPDIVADYGEDVYAAIEVFDPCLTARITRNTAFDGKLIYIGGQHHKDHGWKAFGLFEATAMKEGAIRRLTFLPDGEEPRDLIAIDDKLYLVTAQELEDSYRSRIYSTTDVRTWSVLLEFEADAPAYSIEFMDGYLYIGLGGDHPGSGNIYKAIL